MASRIAAAPTFSTDGSLSRDPPRAAQGRSLRREAERLGEVSRTGCIYLREDEAGAQPFLFQVERRRYREDGRWVPRWHYGQNGRWEFDPRPTREAAIRAGLLALAEREEVGR